jgi:hypothetical protein
MKNRLTVAALGATVALVAACQSSPDVESQRLQSALHRSSQLSDEIVAWRSDLSGPLPTSVAETVESFKSRASDLCGEIDDVSNEVKGDVQIPAIQQSLDTLADIETERFDSTSPAGRATLLDQIQSAAVAEKAAVQRAHQGSLRST